MNHSPCSTYAPEIHVFIITKASCKNVSSMLEVKNCDMNNKKFSSLYKILTWLWIWLNLTSMTREKIKLDHITQTQMRLGKVVSFFVNSWFSVPNLIDRIDSMSTVSVMFENDNKWVKYWNEKTHARFDCFPLFWKVHNTLSENKTPETYTEPLMLVYFKQFLGFSQ